MPPLTYKIKLFQGLLTGEEARLGPFFMDVDLTRRCNLRCPGCRYHSPHLDLKTPGDHRVKDLAPEILARLLAELPALGIRELVFTGEGEPLLHPQVFAFIAAAKKTGVHVGLLTNGTLLDDRRAQALVDSGPARATKAPAILAGPSPRGLRA